MSSESPHPEARADSDGRRLPRWAWMSGIAVALALLIVATVLLTGGGHERPGHGSNEDDAPASRTVQPTGHTPPEGAH